MDELIRKAAADRRSGAAEIAATAARGLGSVRTRAEVLRAARLLLRAHPAMAPLWRMLAEALDGEDPARVSARWVDRLVAEAAATASAARWVLGRRADVVTHSASSSVFEALRASRSRIRSVTCTESRPGGEGARFARRLVRDGFDARVVPDSAMLDVCRTASVVLVGADAVTEEAVINKTGTSLLAVAAREAGTGCYAVAGTAKLLPAVAWFPERAPRYDATPLALFDGVVGERGSVTAGRVRRAARAIEIPEALVEILR